MKQNKTKHLVSEGKAAVGTFCYLPTPWTVEIAGLAGMDFVIIDLEHTARDMGLVESMVVAAELYSMTAIVRVASADEKQILQVLETGAQGIIVPMVNSADTARRALEAAKYPPDGKRGVCRSTRAAQFGLPSAGFRELAQEANDEILVIAMIEDKEGVANAAEIAGSGVDGVLMGPADLSGSLGVLGDLGNPVVRDAMDHVIEAVTSSNAAWLGDLVFSPEQVSEGMERGVRFFAYGIDTQILGSAYKNAVKESRVAMESANGPDVPIARKTA